VLGIKIIVIFGQKREALKRWLNENPSPFLLLIDETRLVIKRFNVFNPINIDAFRIAHPSMFLIINHEIVHTYVGSNQKDRPTIEIAKEIVNKNN
jgi:peroxiredoxin